MSDPIVEDPPVEEQPKEEEPIDVTPVEEKEPKPPVDKETGTKEELKTNAVDPNDIDDDPESPTFGKERFLSWETKKGRDGTTYLEAIGKDADGQLTQVYRINEKTPEVVQEAVHEVEIVTVPIPVPVVETPPEPKDKNPQEVSEPFKPKAQGKKSE